MADRPVIELKPLQTPLVLPDAFPDQVAAPSFQCGDQVRWTPAIAETETDTGWVIGYFYAYARGFRCDRSSRAKPKIFWNQCKIFAGSFAGFSARCDRSSRVWP